MQKTMGYEEYLSQPDGEGTEEKKGKGYWGTQLLVLLQIAVCTLIVCAVLLLKYFGGNWYTSFLDWYNKEVNNSIVAGENLQAYQNVLDAVLPPQKSLPNTTSSNQK